MQQAERPFPTWLLHIEEAPMHMPLVALGRTAARVQIGSDTLQRLYTAQKGMKSGMSDLEGNLIIGANNGSREHYRKQMDYSPQSHVCCKTLPLRTEVW